MVSLHLRLRIDRANTLNSPESGRTPPNRLLFIYSSPVLVDSYKMSATQTTADPAPLDGETKEEHLLAYLRDEAAEGELYFKSKFIADDVGLSPKEIGALMVKIRENATDLVVEKWSYTSATTWRVQAV